MKRIDIRKASTVKDKPTASPAPAPDDDFHTAERITGEPDWWAWEDALQPGFHVLVDHPANKTPYAFTYEHMTGRLFRNIRQEILHPGEPDNESVPLLHRWLVERRDQN